MLKSMDLSTTRVAFWTGFAESALMAAELVTAVPMSRLSDQLGRRPILVTSMLWSAVTCAGLGLSSTVAEVIIWRLLGE
jgi:MFS family permease